MQPTFKHVPPKVASFSTLMVCARNGENVIYSREFHIFVTSISFPIRKKPVVNWSAIASELLYNWNVISIDNCFIFLFIIAMSRVHTLKPSWAALIAVTYPPGPEPITTKSASCCVEYARLPNVPNKPKLLRNPTELYGKRTNLHYKHHEIIWHLIT